MPSRFLDVSHEALIRGWPRLRGWLDEDRAGLRLQRRITETAEEWQRSSRDNDLLYRGARLIQAQEWRERHEVELNPLEREFLEESIVLQQRLEEQERVQQQRELEAAQKLAEAERRRAEEQIKGRRRQRYFSYGLAVLVFVTGIIAVVAMKQRSAAQNAEKKTSEVASRENVSLAEYSEETGKNTQAFAHLAQALRLNPENRKAITFTAAMLTQLSWHVPLTGSLRHDASVTSEQFSPDGQRVVTTSYDRTARLWDAASGKPIGEPMKHQDMVRSAQFSRDGQRVVTASDDRTARLWDAASGKPIGEPMKHETAVKSAQFSPDGQRVVTASYDNTARLWDAASGKPIGEPMKHEAAIKSAQFSPDGQRVVTSSYDNTARFWDAASGKPIGEPMKHETAVKSAQFSPDGHRVVTASCDRTARFWDAASGKPNGEPMKHEDAVNSAEFSPDGHRVVTASRNRTARLWDAASGKPIGEPMKHEAAIKSAQFSPDGQRVVTSSYDKTARLWDAASGKPTGKPMKHENTVNSAQFSPDGQQVVTASFDNTARLWDAPSMTDKDTKEDILLLAELAEATGGATLETVGQAENLKLLAPEQVIASREKIAAKFARIPLELTPLQRVMKWSVSNRRSRTISPFSQVTVPEWLENRVKEGTVEGLRAALEVDPATARVTAYLGRRLADHAFEQGGDPDEARRARGEADFLTSRAQKLAPDNDEVKKLRDEVIKLQELKTN